MMADGIKLIYVFDGEYNKLKAKTQEKRREAKDKAREEFRTALEEEDVENMGRYAKQLGELDEEKIRESKELLEAMGIAVVQAPGEGEMQCAEIVKSGQAYAVGSQDYDALVVGGRLIQNLTLAKRRRLRNGDYVEISPEMIEYEDTLQKLGVDADQFISLAILSGTDFNLGGVKGIGPKKALALVKDKKYPVLIFKEVEGRMDFDWKEIFEIFKKPNVRKDKIEFPKIDENKIKEILVERHDFSFERVEKQLSKLHEIKKQSAQKTLF
jgi:flap endonuclease-1